MRSFYLMLVAFMVTMLTGCVVYAQAVASAVVVATPPLDYVDAIKQFLLIFGEYKDVPKFGIPMIIAQLLLLLSKTKLSVKLGNYKFIFVSGVTLTVSVLTLTIAGDSVVMIIQNSTIITALSVLIHQIYKRFVK